MLNYLGCLDYLNLQRTLDDLFSNFEAHRLFTLRAGHYNNILTIIRKKLAQTWMQILDGNVAVKHGQIWILDHQLYEQFYDDLIRMQAALKYSRGLKIDMTLDLCGDLRYGDQRYWKEHGRTFATSVKRLKGRPANMILRSAWEYTSDRVIVANLQSLGYEVKETLLNTDQAITDILTGPCSREGLAKQRISIDELNVCLFSCYATNAKRFSSDSVQLRDPANQSILTFGILEPSWILHEMITNHYHHQDNEYKFHMTVLDFRFPDSKMKSSLTRYTENNSPDFPEDQLEPAYHLLP